MTMVNEIEFAQKYVPNQVTESLEPFPFAREEQQQAMCEIEFVERYSYTVNGNYIYA
jgi:hypothetical protein